MDTMRTVEIRGEAIRLGQFLKLADLVDNGSEVKPLVAGGDVSVNGRRETRRGHRPPAAPPGLLRTPYWACVT
jgi:ribosome-associated protein